MSEDATDARRVEQALRESEERFRSVFESAATGIAITDYDGNFEQCNAAYASLLGYTQEELQSRNVRSVLHPEDRDANVAQIERLRRGELPSFEVENRYLAKDGTPVWVRKFVSVLRDDAGNPVHLIALVTSVQERRRALEALRESEARLRLFIENAPAAIAMFDREMRYVGASRMWMTEYRLTQDVLGRSHYDVFPEIPERWKEIHRRAMAGESLESDGDCFERADGTTQWLEWKVLPWFDHAGEIGGIMIASKDVTDRRRGEEALRASEERLRSVLDAMFVFVGMLAPDGTLTEINREPVQIAGVARDDVVGKKFWDCVWWRHDPAARARLEAAFARAVRGEAVRYDETIGTAGDGRAVIDLMLQAVFDDRGLRFVIACAVDVTDRNRSAQAVRDSDRRKDEFLAVLAHELRNPLAPLRTGLDLMKGSVDESVRSRALEVMDRQLGHMVRLVDDLLDVSRISRGKVELKRAPVSVASIVEHALDLTRPLLEAGEHTLGVRLPDEPAFVHGDLTRLSQAVGNLLNNAARYTPKGGAIDVIASIERGEAVIRVVDNGIGIPADALPEVFELFVQVDRDGGPRHGGLGIGLSLVRRLVEMHGGSVGVESEGAGKGSMFTVRLPLTTGPNQTDAQREARAGARAAGRTRVLVVDDNDDAAGMLSMMLTLAGHETRTAHDGEAALAVARDFGPDVVFLDIGLPTMDGYEVARRLRAAPSHAKTLLVALTGWAAPEDRRRTKEAGFDVHLAKPVSRDDVDAILSRWSTAHGHDKPRP
jgi:PAS domain S-box-containing protein